MLLTSACGSQSKSFEWMIFTDSTIFPGVDHVHLTSACGSHYQQKIRICANILVHFVQDCLKFFFLSISSQNNDFEWMIFTDSTR